MPYTLSMSALWLLLTALLGAIIGWLLRGGSRRSKSTHTVVGGSASSGDIEIKALRGERDDLQSELGRLRAELTASQSAGASATARGVVGGSAEFGDVDVKALRSERDDLEGEVGRLRAELQAATEPGACGHEDELKALRTQRDSFDIDLKALRGQRDELDGRVNRLQAELKTATAPVACSHDAELAELAKLRARVADAELAELAKLRARVADAERDSARLAELEPQLAEVRAAREKCGDEVRDLRAQLSAAADAEVARSSAPTRWGFASLAPASDDSLQRARAVYGKAIARDDLKIVEGIGPVLERVLNEAGYTTWADVADASPEDLAAAMVAADERHRIHDPGTWPRQARLAHLGEFEALKALQDVLDGGK